MGIARRNERVGSPRFFHAPGVALHEMCVLRSRVNRKVRMVYHFIHKWRVAKRDSLIVFSKTIIACICFWCCSCNHIANASTSTLTQLWYALTSKWLPKVCNHISWSKSFRLWGNHSIPNLRMECLDLPASLFWRPAGLILRKITALELVKTSFKVHQYYL